MLKEFIAEKHVTLNAIVGIYPANAVGDDVEVYTDETRSEVRATLYGLRQQCEKDSKTEPCVPLYPLPRPCDARRARRRACRSAAALLCVRLATGSSGRAPSRDIPGMHAMP